MKTFKIEDAAADAAIAAELAEANGQEEVHEEAMDQLEVPEEAEVENSEAPEET